MVNGFIFTEFKISPCTVSSTLYRDQSTECRSTDAYRWPILTTAWPLVGLFSLFNGIEIEVYFDYFGMFSEIGWKVALWSTVIFNFGISICKFTTQTIRIFIQIKSGLV